MGHLAKENRATIDVLSIRGTECQMESLSILADATQGIVDIVDPLDLNKQFLRLATKTILGTGVSATFRIDDRMKFDDNEKSSIVEEMGTVNEETDLVFSFSAREPFSAPFVRIQTEVSYSKLDGTKCTRVFTGQLPITNDRDKAEANLNSAVISMMAIHRAAKLAQEGEYQNARIALISTQRLLQRGMNTRRNQREYIIYIKQAERLDGFMRQQQVMEEVFGGADAVGRRQARDDSASKNIIQMKFLPLAALQQSLMHQKEEEEKKANQPADGIVGPGQ